MKRQNSVLHVCLAVLGALVTNQAWADLLLLQNEVKVLRVILNHPDRMRAQDRVLISAISPAGRTFLTRELAAVAVTVATDGRWFYRVVGQTTTAPLITDPLHPTDADTISRLLGTPVAMEMLYASRTPATGSTSVQIASITDRIQHIRGAKAAGQIDQATETMLLGWVGDNIRLQSKEVRAGLGQGPTAALAARAQVLAEANASRRREWLPASNHIVPLVEVDPADIPASSQHYQPDAMWSATRPDIAAWRISSTEGVYTFTCPSEGSVTCVAPDGTISRDKVLRAVFQPATTANLPKPPPDEPCVEWMPCEKSG